MDIGSNPIGLAWNWDWTLGLERWVQKGEGMRYSTCPFYVVTSRVIPYATLLSTDPLGSDMKHDASRRVSAIKKPIKRRLAGKQSTKSPIHTLPNVQPTLCI
jgi:hypothetical protein